MITPNKLIKYGIRRAIVHIVVIFVCRLRSLLYKFILSDNSPDIKNSVILQPTQFVGKGKIVITNAKLGVWPSPSLFGSAGYIEARSSDANIEIHKSTHINNSFIIIADRKEIKIGQRCMIGPYFFVTDSDFHGLEMDKRHNGNYECASVVIEDDVFIGDNVRILKGVKVGRGAVIGSSSVVVSDVDSMSVYAGVPAKKIADLA